MAGIRERLHRLPMAAGVAALCVMLAASVFVGNFRALSGATPKAFIRQGDVKSILEDRADAARNVAVVASRAGLDANAVNAAEAAADALEQGKSAREISRADQELAAAVSLLLAAELEGEEAGNMLRAADDFAEQGSFLRQEARAYQTQAEKAQALYEKLPLRFALPAPDLYEGL